MEMVFRKDRVGYLAGRTIIDPEEGDAAGGGGSAGGEPGFAVPRITARDSKIRFTRV